MKGRKEGRREKGRVGRWWEKYGRMKGRKEGKKRWSWASESVIKICFVLIIKNMNIQEL